MTPHKIIQNYIPLVRFLGQALGEHYEIVLHDFSSPESSVVAIENGFLSGRHKGAAMTNLVLKMLQHEHDQDGEDPESLLNYVSTGLAGQVFNSSTFFIRDEKHNSIGAICINMNTQPIRDAIKALQMFGAGSGQDLQQPKASPSPQESLTGSAEETMDALFETVRLKHAHNVAPSASDKQEFIRDLVLEGAFLFKGSIPYIAKKISMSESTLYRYIAKVKQD